MFAMSHFITYLCSLYLLIVCVLTFIGTWHNKLMTMITGAAFFCIPVLARTDKDVSAVIELSERCTLTNHNRLKQRKIKINAK